MTMIAGSATPRSWPYLRAILMAASFASRPELQKNTSSSPVIAAMRSAACSCSGTWNRLELWMMRPICSVSARVRRGWLWPSVFTAMPASASRYFFSAASHSHTPWPRTNATGWRAYVFITWLMALLLSRETKNLDPKCKTAVAEPPFEKCYQGFSVLCRAGEAISGPWCDCSAKAAVPAAPPWRLRRPHRRELPGGEWR